MQSLWMLVTCAMFAIMGASVKFSADFDANLAQIIFFRGLPSVFILFAWTRLKKLSLVPLSWSLHIRRNLFGISAMWLSFFAMSMLPLPTAVSLTYTAPLFIGIWMLFFGGSQSDPLRVLAVLAGFIGVLVILRPSFGDEQWFPGLLGIISGAFSAVAMMQIRQLGLVGEPEWRTVFIFSSFVCLTSLVVMGAVGWPAIDWRAYLSLAVVGVSGLFGQLALTRAFGYGSTLLTAALQYSTIIFATLLGVLLWGDWPDALAWLGMLLIIVSGLLSAWRTYTENRVLRGESAAKSSAATTKRGAV
ncbi:MAG TPA: DMT family transporter [Paenalcaligenes sp.]|nr:DMT family transporter [Paenalcaligenes sp.]